jgi:hypothetical protein
VDAKNLVAFNAGQATPNGILSQSVTTTPGQTYTLSFNVGVLSYNANEQRLQVTATGSGSLLARTVCLYGNGYGTAKWTSQSFTFVADSTTTTVAFKDVSTVTHNLDLLLDYVCVSATGAAPAPAASPFTNGGFEAGYDGWSQSGYQTIIENGGYRTAEGNRGVAFNAGNMPANAVLSQSFATTPGQKYLLTFSLGVYAFNTSEQRLQVEVKGNGTLLSTAASIYGTYGGQTRWTSQSFTFVADSAVTSLTFRDVSPATFSLDMLLDNVQVRTTN